MGGYGTYKFASQFPDLFAKAQPTVGPPALGIWVPPGDPTGGAGSNTNRMLASVRNIPFLIWNAVQDELVPYAGPVAQAQTFDDLGYRYIFDSFAPAEHLTLAINDQFQPAADFLGHHQGRPRPGARHLRGQPDDGLPGVGTIADHAYYLSDMKAGDGSGGAPLGTIDVASAGFGVGDLHRVPTQHGGGALTGRDDPFDRLLGAVEGVGASAEGGDGRPARHHRDEPPQRDDRPGARAGGLRRDAGGQERRPGDDDRLAGCARRAAFGRASRSCDASQPPRVSISRGLSVHLPAGRPEQPRGGVPVRRQARGARQGAARVRVGLAPGRAALPVPDGARRG